MHVSLRNTKLVQFTKTDKHLWVAAGKDLINLSIFRSANENHGELFDSTILVFKQACEASVTDPNSGVPGAVQSQNNPVPASQSSRHM